jgi:putative copper export protein
MDDLAVARALHVLAVVIWIGGVGMVTMVVLPAVRRGDLGPNRLQVFEAIERRFSWNARIAILIVGLTGLYMIDRADLWDRFRLGEFWWMHAMVAIWLVFAVLLFVAEPLIPRRRFDHWASVQPDAAFGLLQRLHWLLLVLSLVTIFGAVAGSHGWSIF